ncbi:MULTISPECIES: hypothetical protein [unclassified Cetobacterium]|nr:MULTISPECIES: hypothetical protein [unclassified Cetobacterium]
MRYKIYAFFLITVVLIKVETERGHLKKYVKVSNSEKKVNLQILKIQRGV